jgi:hypothetical protein
MTGTGDADASTTADEDAGFDPREASTLLERTRRRTRREFEINSPLLTVIRALVVLLAYAAIWLSVRGQNPYQGPSPLTLAVVYGLVAVVIGVSAVAIRRATTGITRGSPGLRRAELAAVVAAYVAVYVFMGALRYLGVSYAIVYGIMPAAGPLIIVGSAAAGIAASRGEWPGFGASMVVIAVGAGSAFAGPVDVWAVTGVGLCLAVLGHGAATAWQQRR